MPSPCKCFYITLNSSQLLRIKHICKLQCKGLLAQVLYRQINSNQLTYTSGFDLIPSTNMASQVQLTLSLRIKRLLNFAKIRNNTWLLVLFLNCDFQRAHYIIWSVLLPQWERTAMDEPVMLWVWAIIFRIFPVPYTFLTVWEHEDTNLGRHCVRWSLCGTVGSVSTLPCWWPRFGMGNSSHNSGMWVQFRHLTLLNRLFYPFYF